MKDGLSCIGALVIVVGLSVLSYVLDGWALLKLWGWFILPRFASAPALTIAQAIGLAMVVSFLTRQSMPDKEGESAKNAIIRAISLAIVKSLLVVACGWIVAQYV